MQRRTDMKKRDDAVSPVIGVMLMLVVTIIIAAVVSTMAGGLFSTQSPAPTLSAATEYSLSNGLGIDVLSVSEAIDTADLKIQVDALANKTRFFATVSGVPPGDDSITGTGAGITYENLATPAFGNFTLVSGVKMSGDVTLRTSEGTAYNASEDGFPADSVKVDIAPDQSEPPYTTWGGKTETDLSKHWKMNKLPDTHPQYYHMMLFNDGWEWTKSTSIITYYPEGDLNPGDKVSVKIVYVPNGQTIYSSDIRVVS